MLSRRRRDRSVFLKSGWLIRSCMIVGKDGKATVTFSSSIILRESPASKCVIDSIAAPASMQHIRGKIEDMWNMGNGAQKRSFDSRKYLERFMLMPFLTNTSWLSGHPFGFAVVPEVYIIMAGCLTLTPTRYSSIWSTLTDLPDSRNAASSTNPSVGSPIITRCCSLGARFSTSAS